MKKVTIVPIEFFASDMIFQIPEYTTKEACIDVSVSFNDKIYTFERSVQWVEEKQDFKGLIVVEVKIISD